MDKKNLIGFILCTMFVIGVQIGSILIPEDNNITEKSTHNSYNNNITYETYITEFSYIIHKSGSTINCVNGTTGEIEFSGDNATVIFQNVADELSDGGSLYIKAGNYEITNTIRFNIKKWGFKIVGDGDNTLIKFSGDGYAMEFHTSYIYSLKQLMLADFRLTSDQIVLNRNGILITDIYCGTYLDRLTLKNFEYAITITGDVPNGYYFDGIRIYNVRMGIRIISDNYAGSFCFKNIQILGIHEYGIFLDSPGGTNIDFEFINIEYALFPASPAIGIYIWGHHNCISMKNMYIDDMVTAIKLVGFDNNYPIGSATIKDCHFNGFDNWPSAINVSFVRELAIRDCDFSNYQYAIYLYKIKTDSIIIDNPRLIRDCKLLDGKDINQRIFGSVIMPSCTGVIASTNNNVMKGDVVELSGNGAYRLSLRDDSIYSPSVVLFDGAEVVGTEKKPIVIATSGICTVKCDDAVNRGDILTSRNNGEARVNNMADFNQAIGIAVWSKQVGDGTTEIRII